MSILDLWLPIAAATLACFFMSSAIWVLFKWHNSDYKLATTSYRTVLITQTWQKMP
jgi:hypothetical protein